MSTMMADEYSDLRPLLYLASAKRRLRKAEMEASHGSYAGVPHECRSAVKDVLEAAFSLTNRSPLNGIDLQRCPEYLEILKMEFDEMKFFELVRELAQTFSAADLSDDGVSDAFPKIDVLTDIVARSVGKALGLSVVYYAPETGAQR